MLRSKTRPLPQHATETFSRDEDQRVPVANPREIDGFFALQHTGHSPVGIEQRSPHQWCNKVKIALIRQLRTIWLVPRWSRKCQRN